MGSENKIRSKLDNKVVANGKLDDGMEVSPSGDVDGELSRLPKEELGNCVSNREDDMFHMEFSRVGNVNCLETKQNDEDLEVDIVGNIIPDEGEERVADGESKDATECSSSFGFTDSGSGADDMSGGMEVESRVRDDNAMLMGFDGCSDLFRIRKKKLTDEWRKYVRPLMWRCKWVELQIRELQLQEAKYARELAEHDKRKQCEMEKLSTEDHAMKSSPFICKNRPTKLMKRKKRKRVEETVDLHSYTKSHSLFSHFVIKKSGADTANMDDDHGHAGTASGSGEFCIDDELPSLQFKDSDAFESILRKIEEAQVQVRQLRMRMDKVVRKNAVKFASDYSSFAPHEPSTSAYPNSMRPHVNGDSTRICDENDDGILISHGMIKEEFDTSEDVQVQGKLLAETPSGPEGKYGIIQHVSDLNASGKLKMPQEELTAIVRSSSKVSFPTNKKKRAKRKAGRWSKRASG